jgi:hypothetical protein
MVPGKRLARRLRFRRAVVGGWIPVSRGISVLGVLGVVFVRSILVMLLLLSDGNLIYV